MAKASGATRGPFPSTLLEALRCDTEPRLQAGSWARLGFRYPITCQTAGDSEDDARERLYKHYEHITELRLVPLGPGESVTNDPQTDPQE